MKTIYIWQLAGFVSTVLFGTLLHFLYGWTQSILISPFSCINESTWEHMKIAFWPMLIFAIIQYFKFKNREDYWYIKLKGILIGIFLIPIIFYTYNGVIGKSPDWVNITIYIISIGIAYLYEIKQFNQEIEKPISYKIPIAILCLISLLFIIFTFKTPNLGIFIDPITNEKGLVLKLIPF